jgi:Protein of unknown function (DUF3592)
MLWIFAAAGLTFAIYAAVQLYRYRGSGSWPCVEGMVEKVAIRRHHTSEGHYYEPVVSYSFSLAGEFYSGEWVGPAFGKEQAAREFVDQNMPIGGKLTVHYKSEKPALNMLEVDPALWDANALIKLNL